MSIHDEISDYCSGYSLHGYSSFFSVLLFLFYALHNNYMFHMHPFLACPHSLSHAYSIILPLSSPLPHSLILELTPSLHLSPPPHLNFHIHITSDPGYPSLLDHPDKVSLPSLLRLNPLEGTLQDFESYPSCEGRCGPRQIDHN